MRTLSICVAALLALPLAPPAVLGGPPAPPVCVDNPAAAGAIGAPQFYSVTPGATALLITANGASGGQGQNGNGVFSSGGRAAHLIAGVPVSGLTTLEVWVGGPGGNGTTKNSAGGGGGGSFVFTLGGTLLVAAGGGGGASAGTAGGAAQLGTSGASGGGTAGGAGGTSGSGGAGGANANGGNGGGGGGFLSAGGNGAGLDSGFGGLQILLPGDAAGGAAGDASGGAGSYGGGGGAGGSGFSGGGGGGYSGGGGGGSGSGGGGSSFVAAGGTTFASALLTGPSFGTVEICATEIILPPTLTKAFGLASIAPGSTTTLTFTLTNASSIALTGVGFTDTLPDGLLIAQPNGLSGSCDGGTITAPDFTSTVSLAGATLPANGSCSFRVNVVGITTGSKDNTTSAVTSNEAANGAAATATLTVAEGAPIPTLSSWGLLLMITGLGAVGAMAMRRRRRA